MFWGITAILILLVFYSIYISKMLLQKKQGIQTDQIAKREKWDKIFYTELLMKIATYSVVLAEGVSIFTVEPVLPIGILMIGVLLGIAGDIIFAVNVRPCRFIQKAIGHVDRYAFLMPTRIFPFTGLTHFDKIIAEFHRIPATIHQVFVEHIGRVIAKAPPQIFQNVYPQEFALFIIHLLAEQVPGADVFQLKMLDILYQAIYQPTQGNDSLTGVSTVHFIQEIVIAKISHCFPPRFLHHL